MVNLHGPTLRTEAVLLKLTKECLSLSTMRSNCSMYTWSLGPRDGSEYPKPLPQGLERFHLSAQRKHFVWDTLGTFSRYCTSTMGGNLARFESLTMVALT
jgi:hypothetical protein